MKLLFSLGVVFAEGQQDPKNNIVAPTPKPTAAPTPDPTPAPVAAPVVTQKPTPMTSTVGKQSPEEKAEREIEFMKNRAKEIEMAMAEGKATNATADQQMAAQAMMDAIDANDRVRQLDVARGMSFLLNKEQHEKYEKYMKGDGLQSLFMASAASPTEVSTSSSGYMPYICAMLATAAVHMFV